MTDTERRDVNAAFRQSKMDQITNALATARSDRERAEALRAEVTRGIESGELTDLGDGRYRVTQGWDQGEVLRINTTAPELSEDEIRLAILGDHGLDTTADGRTALYVAGEPAWHQFGTCIPQGLTSVEGVLRAAGLDWEVVLTPQGGINPVTGKYEEVGEWSEDAKGNRVFTPTAFHTRHSGTGAVLGSVGKIYTPLQNAEAYEFLDGLFGAHEMRASSAGSFRDGRRVFITAELPDELIVDPSGFADHIRQYVAILNSHDGSSPVTAITTPWRVECANTERFALRDAAVTWKIRHTKNAKNKLRQAAETLNLTTQYYLAWQEEEMELVRTPFHDNQIDALCDQIWGEKPDDNDASKRAVTLDTNRREKVREIFRHERDRVGSTAYAAERAVTGYLDHFAELRPRGALRGNRLGALGVSLMEDTTGEVKTRAHRKLMLLARQ